MSIELVMPSNHLILCSPLLLLPSLFPSIRVFSNESALCIRWPKYWSFSFSISPSSEHSGLISFKIDWFDLLAVQGILKSLFQHHDSKASILRCSASFMARGTHICFFPNQCCHSLDKFPESRQLDHREIFKGISILLYIVKAAIYIPNKCAWEFPFLYIHGWIGICQELSGVGQLAGKNIEQLLAGELVNNHTNNTSSRLWLM